MACLVEVNMFTSGVLSQRVRKIFFFHLMLNYALFRFLLNSAGPALPALIGKKFTVALKPVPPNSPVLQAYVDIGNRLKTSRSSEMVNIEAGVTDFVHAVNQYPAAYPAMFAFLSGSSGLGKTQLAFALKRKVLYIPQSESVVLQYFALLILL